MEIIEETHEGYKHIRSPVYLFKCNGLTCATYRDRYYRHTVTIKYDREIDPSRPDQYEWKSNFFKYDISNIVALLKRLKIKKQIYAEKEGIIVEEIKNSRISITKTYYSKKEDMPKISFQENFNKEDIEIVKALLWKAEEQELPTYRHTIR